MARAYVGHSLPVADERAAGERAADEQVAVLDEGGAVVGVRPRAEVRRHNLRHAATAVVLRHPDGRLYVHRRSPTKDWMPSAHDAAAGGVLQAGEEPDSAAARELAEELGVTGVALTKLLTGRYDDDTTRYVAHVYEATYDGAVRFADGEVVWGAWMTLEELAERWRDPAWPFVPDTRALLEQLAREDVGDYGLLAR
jgi:isopentenyldiphosphate isomerase